MQNACVYFIMQADKLGITAKALEQLQERLMEMYTHEGKRRAFKANLTEYLACSNSAEDNEA
jgi:hypothetical protein